MLYGAPEVPRQEKEPTQRVIQKERILFIFFTLYMVYVNISELICIKTAQVGTIMTQCSKNTSVQQS